MSDLTEIYDWVASEYGKPLVVYPQGYDEQHLEINEGEIVQQGKPKMLYENPENTFTAKFLGNPPMNLINLFAEGDDIFNSIIGEKYFTDKKFSNKNYKY